jgi:hypothetical protein
MMVEMWIGFVDGGMKLVSIACCHHHQVPAVPVDAPQLCTAMARPRLSATVTSPANWQNYTPPKQRHTFGVDLAARDQHNGIAKISTSMSNQNQQ